MNRAAHRRIAVLAFDRAVFITLLVFHVLQLERANKALPIKAFEANTQTLISVGG